MNSQDTIDYLRIAEAIEYIKENFKSQPALDEVAEKMNLSPFHFQRLFTEWAGVSPKKFLQYLSVEYAKSILKENQATLFDTAAETGLSGTGRLHDLFVKIEGMTPGEYKNGGENLRINYQFTSGIFGSVLIATTSKGVCYLAFTEDSTASLEELKGSFPNALFQNVSDPIQEKAVRIFSKENSTVADIKLHLKGTDFQLKVWEALLKIPLGELSTYGKIASEIDNPKASRAVGTAIGSNPVAFLIPCHRVIQSTGIYGEYRWGSIRKSVLIGWEAAKVSDFTSH